MFGIWNHQCYQMIHFFLIEHWIRIWMNEIRFFYQYSLVNSEKHESPVNEEQKVTINNETRRSLDLSVLAILEHLKRI